MKLKKVFSLILITAMLISVIEPGTSALAATPTPTPPSEETESLPAAPYASTDDYFSSAQWTLNNYGAYTHISGSTEGIIITTPDIDIDAPEAWAIYNKENTSTREVVVAVIDTGVDYKHPELEGSMWINEREIPDDGIDNDGNGYIDDVYGWDFYNNDATVCHYEYNERLGVDLSSPLDCDDHGTHCAGIIAAAANNKIGIAGVASNVNVKIMSLKIHGGADRKGSISDAIKAIKYAESMGADICNISWGSYVNSTSLRTAISQSNMLFVCAAGNDGSDNDDKPLYPASYDLDNVISVAYVDANGTLAQGSNYGSKSVDLAAPSVDVFSTIVGSYSSMSGSSMAAPHVAGIAAMLYAYTDGLSAANIKDIIIKSVKELPDLKGYLRTPGIPSAYSAVELISELSPDVIAPNLSITKTFSNDMIELEFLPEDEGGSGVHMLRYFVGKKSLSDFKHGTVGTVVTNNKLLLAKAGTYTFYVNDHAGNEMIKHFYVLDDTNAPKIADPIISVAYSYKSITLKALVTDTGSGIKTVRYAQGEKEISDFSSGRLGTTIVPSDDTVSFKVTEPGLYTIYTIDYRGNKTVSTINAEIIKSESLKLSRKKKTITVGKTYKIKYTMLPENTTDKVKFKSSDKSVAKVSSKGKVTAVAPGKATITVTTASGIKAKITITVKEPG